MNCTASIATQESDELIKEQTINRGRWARLSDLDESANPYDPLSIIGQWWEYGFNSVLDTK